jgi:CRISPR-associated protein Cmr3
MRKAVAAGAVYWFELLDEPPAQFLASLWLAPLSDDPQDQRDGFGLGLPAPWSPVA